MRIGIFGGSFDPVHKEHIAFAHAAVEGLRLDTLFVVPAHTPPHKLGKTLSSNEDRLTMCRMAFAALEKVEVSSYEIEKGGTSYTYLTCEHFRSLYPSAELFFLAGTDMLRDFPTWKRPDLILQNATLAVCGRCEEEGWERREKESFRQKFGVDFCHVPYNGAKVSSTKIRILAGAGMRLNDFVEENVETYIEREGLYRIKNASTALALETPSRRAHSLRVAELAVARAASLKLPEKKVITAALFHDCAKNIGMGDPCLKDFSPPTEWGEPPSSVYHQFAGAYLAKTFFGVEDEDVLNAIRFHTSARENMSELEKLIFLADMLEEARAYEGVELLRYLFWRDDSLDACLAEALFQTLEFLKEKKAEIYPLTQYAYEFYKDRR